MYTTTRNDLDTFLKMDAFWDETTPVNELEKALQDDNWQVQQAGLSAIGDRGETSTIPAIIAILDEQDQLPIYSCPEEWDFESATNEDEKETWRCRFRVKQAALVAISKCVDKNSSDLVGDNLCQKIMDYALNQDEDYPVRMAACHLLGQIKRPEAKSILEQASQDGEWCTATTAKEALKKL